MSDKNLYACRDTVAQDEHFYRHMDRMTVEDLRGKAGIAAELAHRDIEIERLTDENAKLRAERDALIPAAARPVSIHDVDKLLDESRIMQAALRNALKAIDSVPADTFGFGTLTDAHGEEQVYPLRDELSQEILTALSAVSTEQEEP